LQTLRQRGLKLGLVSNTFVPPATHDRHLREAGLIDYLPVRVYSSAVRFRKPHPKIFQIALQRLGTQPQETLFVGDMIKADIQGARRLGMATVLRQGRGAMNNHQPAADYAVCRISELLEVVPDLKQSDQSRQAPALRR
jgi:putative hydrolase of the HAD superfamily